MLVGDSFVCDWVLPVAHIVHSDALLAQNEARQKQQESHGEAVIGDPDARARCVWFYLDPPTFCVWALKAQLTPPSSWQAVLPRRRLQRTTLSACSWPRARPLLAIAPACLDIPPREACSRFRWVGALLRLQRQFGPNASRRGGSGREGCVLV